MKIRRGSIRLTEQDLVNLVKTLNVKTKQTIKSPILIGKSK